MLVKGATGVNELKNKQNKTKKKKQTASKPELILFADIQRHGQAKKNQARKKKKKSSPKNAYIIKNFFSKDRNNHNLKTLE